MRFFHPLNDRFFLVTPRVFGILRPGDVTNSIKSRDEPLARLSFFALGCCAFTGGTGGFVDF